MNRIVLLTVIAAICATTYGQMPAGGAKKGAPPKTGCTFCDNPGGPNVVQRGGAVQGKSADTTHGGTVQGKPADTTHGGTTAGGKADTTHGGTVQGRPVDTTRGGTAQGAPATQRGGAIQGNPATQRSGATKGEPVRSAAPVQSTYVCAGAAHPGLLKNGTQLFGRHGAYDADVVYYDPDNGSYLPLCLVGGPEANVQQVYGAIKTFRKTYGVKVTHRHFETWRLGSGANAITDPDYAFTVGVWLEHEAEKPRE